MQRLRVMSWNIENGGGDRLQSIAVVVAEAAPDVLVLQECVDWSPTGANLRIVAEAMGVNAWSKQVFLGVANPRPSGRRYSIAVLSKLPLEQCQAHTAGFAHVVVDVVVGGLRVLGTHLVWNDEDARLLELQALLRVASSSSSSLLLAGDLNALSRADPYPADLGERLADVGIHKYGLPPRFDVTDALRAAGFVDPLPSSSSSSPPALWWTARREHQGQAVLTRSDYLLLSAALAPAVQRSFVVDAAGAADHNAVVVDLDL